MDFGDRIRQGFVLWDGGMGTMLQREGLDPAKGPVWEQAGYPAALERIQSAYLEAGAMVLSADTFSANEHTLADRGRAAEIVSSAVAATRRIAGGAALTALDLGPLGPLMAPMGELTFADACRQYEILIEAGVQAGAEVILIETMSDLLELKAAVLTARSCCNLPVCASLSCGEGGRTFVGTDPLAAALTLEALGVAAVGLNCSLGPAGLAPILERLRPHISIPLLAQPNAGLPQSVDGRFVYTVGPEEFARETAALSQAGARILGGCCGTTPDHIGALVARLERLTPPSAAAPGEPVLTTKDRVIPLDSLEELDCAVLPVGLGDEAEELLEQALELGEDCDFLWLELAPGADPAAVEAIQGMAGVALGLAGDDSATLLAAARVYAGLPAVRFTGEARELPGLREGLRAYGGRTV